MAGVGLARLADPHVRIAIGISPGLSHALNDHDLARIGELKEC